LPSLRDALEAALIEDPDDVATHRAYADYLQEQGDPRGELIQVQLALEEAERTDEERQALQARERELLAEHQRAWLGILADELLGPIEDSWESRDERRYEFRFARGWLDRIVRFRSTEGSTDLGRRLAQAPQVRLLRELVLEYDEGVVEQLIGSPFLNNLRLLHLKTILDHLDEPDRFVHGCEALVAFVRRLPHIEQLLLFGSLSNPSQLFALPNLQNLRVLQVRYSVDFLPLETLTDNPALGQLTHLLLHPQPSQPPPINLAGIRAVLQSPHLQSLTHLQLHRSDLGDVGCTEIVTSGILKRLKVLDLGHGEITDTGARILADCPDLRRLECLNLEYNALTQTGIDTLRRALGSALQAGDQRTSEERGEGH
jgi:uncharacterized protein (TIGR02996 family)